MTESTEISYSRPRSFLDHTIAVFFFLVPACYLMSVFLGIENYILFKSNLTLDRLVFGCLSVCFLSVMTFVEVKRFSGRPSIRVYGTILSLLGCYSTKSWNLSDYGRPRLANHPELGTILVLFLRKNEAAIELSSTPEVPVYGADVQLPLSSFFSTHEAERRFVEQLVEVWRDAPKGISDSAEGADGTAASSLWRAHRTEIILCCASTFFLVAIDQLSGREIGAQAIVGAALFGFFGILRLLGRFERRKLYRTPESAVVKTL